MKVERLSETIAAMREGFIATPQDAMDLIATARYETGCEALILPKAALNEDFSHYTSKPL